MDPGLILVGLAGPAAGIISGIASARVRRRQVAQQARADAIEGFDELVGRLEEEVTRLTSELVEVRADLAARRRSHHDCIEELAIMRLQLHLLVQSVPENMIPAPVRETLINAEREAEVRRLARDAGIPTTEPPGGDQHP